MWFSLPNLAYYKYILEDSEHIPRQPRINYVRRQVGILHGSFVSFGDVLSPMPAQKYQPVHYTTLVLIKIWRGFGYYSVTKIRHHYKSRMAKTEEQLEQMLAPWSQGLPKADTHLLWIQARPPPIPDDICSSVHQMGRPLIDITLGRIYHTKRICHFLDASPSRFVSA